MKRPLLCALAVAVASSLSGCYTQPAPSIQVLEAHVVESTDDGVVVLFTLEGENRGSEALPLRTVNYSVSIAGKRIFEGLRSAERTLPRAGSQTLTLPAAASMESFPAGPPRAGEEYEISGSIEYETPGVLSDILFDAGVRRPTVHFSGSGALAEARPRRGHPMPVDASSPPRIPPRDPASHKGTFGTVGVVGGRVSAGAHMLGGPAFSALAALRSGCGLARLALPEPLLEAGLTLAPSATGIPLRVDPDGTIVPHLAAEALDRMLDECRCVAIGPGLGLGEGPRAMTLRLVAQRDVPVVVDADALNSLAEIPDAHRDFHAPGVLTPHPGEYARLATALGVDADPIDRATRPDACERLAQRLGCVVVLKGAHTVVSDGHRTWISPHANPALATAGTGDVLTGVVAGLVAQLFRPPGGTSLYDCARLGVVAHALAAERWSKRAGATAGLLATDLLDEIPGALQSMRGL